MKNASIFSLCSFFLFSSLVSAQDAPSRAAVLNCADRIAAGYQVMTAPTLALGELQSAECELTKAYEAQCVFTYRKPVGRTQIQESEVQALVSFLDGILCETVFSFQLRQEMKR